ncbi:STAS domain-containing protein [Amycolatopsis sp. NPDC004368]
MGKPAPSTSSVAVPHTTSLLVTTTAAFTTVTVRGDIDLTVTPRLAELLAVELELAPAALVIDLSEVPFCSSAGLSTLVEVHESARAAGVPCAVVTDQYGVLRPIRLLALDRVLRIHPTLRAARDWLEIAARR